MRYVFLTPRVHWDWLFERINVDICISVRRATVNLQTTYVMTKSSFTRDKWIHVSFFFKLLSDNHPHRSFLSFFWKKRNQVVILVFCASSASSLHPDVSDAREQSCAKSKARSKDRTCHTKLIQDCRRECRGSQDVNNKTSAERFNSRTNSRLARGNLVGWLTPHIVSPTLTNKFILSDVTEIRHQHVLVLASRFASVILDRPITQ